jgi:hypothetical protein
MQLLAATQGHQQSSMPALLPQAVEPCLLQRQGSEHLGMHDLLCVQGQFRQEADGKALQLQLQQQQQPADEETAEVGPAGGVDHAQEQQPTEPNRESLSQNIDIPHQKMQNVICCEENDHHHHHQQQQQQQQQQQSIQATWDCSTAIVHCVVCASVTKPLHVDRWSDWDLLLLGGDGVCAWSTT